MPEVAKIDKRSRAYKQMMKEKQAEVLVPVENAVESAKLETTEESTIILDTAKTFDTIEESIHEELNVAVEEKSLNVVTEDNQEATSSIKDTLGEVNINSDVNSTSDINITEHKYKPGDVIWVAIWCRGATGEVFGKICDIYKYRPQQQTIKQVIISADAIRYSFNNITNQFEDDMIRSTASECQNLCNKLNQE